MFFISKNVAAGIKALRNREDVARELEAIRSMPGFEVYANAIAEGLSESAARKVAKPRAARRPIPASDDGGAS